MGATNTSHKQDLFVGYHCKVDTLKLDEDKTSRQSEGTSGRYQEDMVDGASHISVSEGMAQTAIEDWETEEDLTNHSIFLADERLLEVYSYTVRWNGSQHLCRWIKYDVNWQIHHKGVT